MEEVDTVKDLKKMFECQVQRMVYDRSECLRVCKGKCLGCSPGDGTLTLDKMP